MLFPHGKFSLTRETDSEHNVNFFLGDVDMILTPRQAKEIGEALIDASEDVVSFSRDHVVVTICGSEAAVSMMMDCDLEDYGYEPLFTVKAG
jgi:hypothetical protein